MSQKKKKKKKNCLAPPIISLIGSRTAARMHVVYKLMTKKKTLKYNFTYYFYLDVQKEPDVTNIVHNLRASIQGGGGVELTISRSITFSLFRAYFELIYPLGGFWLFCSGYGLHPNEDSVIFGLSGSFFNVADLWLSLRICKIWFWVLFKHTLFVVIFFSDSWLL